MPWEDSGLTVGLKPAFDHRAHHARARKCGRCGLAKSAQRRSRRARFEDLARRCCLASLALSSGSSFHRLQRADPPSSFSQCSHVSISVWPSGKDNDVTRSRFRKTIFRTCLPDREPGKNHDGLGVLAWVGIFDGSLLCIRRRQVWMRAFRICGRSLDRGACGLNSLLDFLFSRCQRIVRHV